MTRRRQFTGAFFLAAMLTAAPFVARAAATTPPEPLAGLVARDIPGVSASPDRVWAATLATFRSIGLPAPTGTRWEYLPWDTPVLPNGDTIEGFADIDRGVVRVHPFKAVGDARDLPAVMAHEVAHLVSYQVETRGPEV